MQSIIRAWGNSQGLYIPKKLLNEASLNVNDPVDISVVDGILMIRRDESKDHRRNALEALCGIREAHKDAGKSINLDYREERNSYLEEKYGR